MPHSFSVMHCMLNFELQHNDKLVKDVCYSLGLKASQGTVQDN